MPWVALKEQSKCSSPFAQTKKRSNFGINFYNVVVQDSVIGVGSGKSYTVANDSPLHRHFCVAHALSRGDST